MADRAQPPGARPPSNFSFLRAGWPALCLEGAKAEQSAIADPRTACFYARRSLELAVTWLYDADAALRRPYKDDLSAMLFEPTFQASVEKRIRTKMDLIRREGNAAVHRRKAIQAETSLAAVRELFHVLFWLARTYTREGAQAPPTDLRFDPAAIPRAPTKEQREQGRDALRRQATENAARDAELEQARRSSEELQAELERLRAEIATVKAANAARPDDHDYDEQTTRDLYIDLLLREAGWPLDEDRDREFEVVGMPNPAGRGYVDYILWGEDGLPLGLVEAKRTRRDAKVGRQQAKLYADSLEQRFGRRPVIFYSNGYETWLWDDERYPPRQVQGFYTKDELALLVQRRNSRKPLGSIEISERIVERPYQHRAIRRIAEAFERDKQRRALTVMATGAGKTRMTIALIDLLMRAGWVKRALFLADRLALVNQTVGAFKAHLPDVATVNLVTEKSSEGRVFVSTYPTMMGLIGGGEGGEQRRFGAGHFDLVVIDEAHRSIYAKYRSIFSYFDSLLVGLTATPKDEVDRNTYGLFGLEPGVPTDAYTLEEAVADGYLVPPRAIDVPLKFPREGVRYEDLTEEEKEQWEEQDWGEEEMPEEIGAEAINRWLFNDDTVDKVLETLMRYGHHVAGGDRLGKTIVFAKNNAHAEFIAERFDANYPERAGHFARPVTYRTEYAQSLIDDFSIKEKAPHVAISVDMLDTGIDVPEVVNLVFFKRVRSKTKFWQMIGRGTRLCPQLYGPGEDKKDFRIFDFCENLAFFNQQIELSEDRLSPSLNERVFGERLELVVALRGERGGGDGTESAGGLRDDTIAALRERVAGMNTDNFIVRPQRRWVERFREAEPWSELELEQARELNEHVGDLPSTVEDSDETAKRFDLIILGLQIRRLRPEPGGERLRRQVQEIAAGLLEQTSIPVIAEQHELLEELVGDEWWVDVTIPMLERARRRIRDLVRLLERRRRAIVYTDFVDSLGEIVDVDLVGLEVGTDFERFREKARAYLRDHLDHVAVQKLRRNRPLAELDIEELERILAESGIGDASEIARAAADGLGAFVRSLVGLDRAAATEALSGFIAKRPLGAAQLDFVQMVVDHLTENGMMAAEILYEAPFTTIAPQGPDGIFPSADVEDLIAVIERVRANAMPTEAAA